jgi:hypothetical protein
VAEFTPRRPQKFQDLAPAKEVIVELRRKRASYRAIAELLTQHCLPTSKTAIAAYCHEVLEERVRSKRRVVPKRTMAAGESAVMADSPPAAVPGPSLMEKLAALQPPETGDPAARGPRIAKVRVANPTES